VGSVLPDRVAKLLPGVGLNVQLGARLFGRVHLTDVRDRWTEAPLEGVAEGQFVRCCVVHAGDKLDLSLRASRGGCEASTAAPSSAKVPSVPPAL
jgi:ribosomal protein S1